MQLKLLQVWPDSGGNNCPAFYQAENGDFVVQGWQLDADTTANLQNLASDESAVRIPASLVAAIVAAQGN